jgi:hypothetical protein
MVTEFKIWQTITLGTCVGGPHYCELIDARTGLNSDNYAQTLLKSRGFTISANQYEIDLTHVGVTELGFNEHEATYEEVCARAIERGLVLCPTDAGPELYLKVQPKRWGAGVDRVMMGMTPIEDDKDGEMHVFSMEIASSHPHLSRGCNLRTEIKNGKPIRLIWSNYYHFAFVLPRKKEVQKEEDGMSKRRGYYREVKGPSIQMLNPAIFPGLR